MDSANREFRLQGSELHLYQSRHRARRQALLDACRARERRTKLVLAPAALELARSNTSKVIKKSSKGEKGAKGGKNGKGGKGGKFQKGGKGGVSRQAVQWITWRVEWRFGKCGEVLVDRALKEDELLGRSLNRFLDNSWPLGATRHLVLPYADFGLEGLEVFMERPAACKEDENDEGSASLAAVSRGGGMTGIFDKLDKARSIRENLMDRAVVEFPVLHVALPTECDQFPGPAADTAVPAAKAQRQTAPVGTEGAMSDGGHGGSGDSTCSVQVPPPPPPPSLLRLLQVLDDDI